MIFVDWLTVEQEYESGSLPVVGQEVRIGSDIATGELLFKTITSVRHAGSYDTSLQIRCDGTRVQVSGNPSAFGRVDNVYGYGSVQDAMVLVNRVVESLGLPVFQRRPFSGPKVRRIDLTCNFRCGGVLETLRLLSGFCVRGKPGFLYANGRTVDWFRGSRRLYVKYYCKAFDLQDKARTLARRLKKLERAAVKGITVESGVRELGLSETEVSDETGREIDTTVFRTCEDMNLAIQELSGLVDYVQSVNMIRWEVSLKGKLLTEMGLCDIDAWENRDMSNVIDKWAFHKQAKFEETKTDDFIGLFIAAGIPIRKARLYNSYASAWMRGEDVHYRTGYMSRPQYYKARAALLTIGIDIANPPNVAAMPLRTVSIKCEPLSPPDWYTLPKVA